MLVQIKRSVFTEQSTIGKIFLNEVFQCCSLERALKDPDYCAIPLGTYEMEWYNSPHFNLTVPLLKNVPDRTMIEIHPANYPEQLKGCIAPGVIAKDDSVFQSRVAWEHLIGQMKQAQDKILIEVSNI